MALATFARAHGNAARVSRPNPSFLDFAPELLGLAPRLLDIGMDLTMIYLCRHSSPGRLNTYFNATWNRG